MLKKGTIVISETILMAFGIIVTFFILSSLGSIIFSDQAENAEDATLGYVAKEIASMIDNAAGETGNVGMIYEMPKGVDADIEISYKMVTVRSGDAEYSESFIATTHTEAYTIEDANKICIVKNQDDMRITVSNDRCVCNPGDGKCDVGCLLTPKCDEDCYRDEISDNVCDVRCVENSDGICDPDCGSELDKDCDTSSDNEKENVFVQFFIMSECPYGIRAIQNFMPVMEEFKDVIDFRLDFVGWINETTGLPGSKHGASEVLGDKIEICAQKYEPEKFLYMMDCVYETTVKVPDKWEECAAETSISTANIEKIRTCAYGDEGTNMLLDSISNTESRSIVRSPTMFFNGEEYIISVARDDYFEENFMNMLKTEYLREQVCKQIPNDMRCNVMTDDYEEIDWEKNMVTVAGDGTGDYNCEGTTCHDEINEALEFVSAHNDEYTTVHLKGPYTFSIDRTLKIGKGNIILEGEEGVVLTVTDNPTKSFWGNSDTPLIGQKTISSSNIGKIVIRNFEIDGNHDKVKITDKNPLGRGSGYYILMLLWYEDVDVYNMYMHDSSGDGLQIRNSKYTKFHNNRVVDLGHDVVFAKDCQNLEYWNNHVKTMTNSAFRAMNSKDLKIHDNVMYTIFGEDAGGPGIQLQLDRKGSYMNNIEIYNNLIYDTYGPGIWLIGKDTTFSGDSFTYTKDQAKDVYIHNNIFYNCGTHPTYGWMAGIVTSGFYDTVIENNVFDGSHGGGIVYLEAYFDAGGTSGKYTTYVRNNIITNTVKLGGNRIVGSIIGSASNTGQAIINYHPSESIFYVENNIIYNNVGGNYKNVASSSDIYQNPLYVDQANHDYHVKSNSPAIDAGYPSSPYSNEPEPNGDRINIGRYGNTDEATISNQYA